MCATEKAVIILSFILTLFLNKKLPHVIHVKVTTQSMDRSNTEQYCSVILTFGAFKDVKSLAILPNIGGYTFSLSERREWWK
jgi:hypothetical protein